MNPTMESTPSTQEGPDTEVFPSPPVPPTSSLPPPPKMSASPRPRMPAGPRVRKNTAGTLSLTAQRSATPLNFADYPPLPGSDRNSPGPSASESSHSASIPPHCHHPLPPNEKAVQTEPVDPIPSMSTISTSTPVPPQAPATPDSTRPSTPASVTYRVITKPTTLPTPTPLNFNVDPIAFKGIPLEAAQWSFTSEQLREMVSRAIRDSAKEQFIRLLSLDALDKEIPEELDRLESLKFTTQAQHRFHFQRRTNLLQSLNALSNTTIPPAETGTNSTLGMLIQQLAEVTASMDRFTETLLSTSEHRSQLAQVQEKHLSSALAVALRKLNASYAKRTADLKNARARIAALETELEEAWKVADRMAEEIDDLDNFRSDYAIEDRFEDGEADMNSVQDDDPTIISVANAQVVPVTSTAIVSKATLVRSLPTNGVQQLLTPPNNHARRPRPSNASAADRDRFTKLSTVRKRISLISQSAIKVQRSNSMSDGGSDLSTSESRRERAGSRSKGKGKEPVSASPSLPSNTSNNSFLELSRSATPQPSDEEVTPPVPSLAKVQPEDDSVGASNRTGIKLDMGQIQTDGDHQANLDYSPAFSAAFDSTMIPPPPPDSDLPSPLTRASSVNLHHPPPTQDTRRIQSMQPSLSVPSSLQDRDLEDRDWTGCGEDIQDSPKVSDTKITQAAEEVHIVPLPDVEEDDNKLSASHHSYDKSDLWPWTKRNTALLTDAAPEPSPPSIDDKIDPDPVVNIGPSISVNVTAENEEDEHASSMSYLPDMTSPSTDSVNGDGTANTDSAVSVIASEDTEEHQDEHNGVDQPESGTRREEPLSQEPPSPAPSDVPDMPVFPPARNSTVAPERHGSIGSLVARKSSFFRSNSNNSSHEKRSSMPLPSAVIASLLPWRGSKRPSSEPELPSQSSRERSRLSSSLPSPH